LSEFHHLLRINANLGPLHVSANMTLSAPWTILFGPSGSGKSTILRAACGLVASADVHFTQTLPDRQNKPRSLERLPTHRRNLAYAPQGSVLFPHLTVRQNVAFATNLRRQPHSAATDAALDLFQLIPLTHRLPRDLSGGERQRVNLARAFAVPAPHLILLDDPFTGVDRSLRDVLLPRMQQHATQQGIPVLSVTHDVEEALILQAEVIRLEQGVIVAQGPSSRVLADERGRMLNILQR
jgi:ABC-type sulfate/molybdate transport systems ATPase subunit